MVADDKIANAVWDKFKVDIVKNEGWYTVNSTAYVGHDKVKEINLFIDEITMAEGKKNPKEASNIFHSIMKASVKQEKFVPEECPECGAMGNFIPPTVKRGQNLYVTFVCPNGHEFTKTLHSK